MRCKKHICIWMLLIFISFLQQIAGSAQEEKSVELYADGKGCFYVLQTDGRMNTVSYYNGETSNRIGTPEATAASELLINSNGVYLISQFSNVFSIFSPIQQKTEFINDIYPKSGCIVITDENTVYLTQEGEERIIRCYRSFCQSENNIRVPYAVGKIFLSEDGSPFALTENGVFDIESGYLMQCDTPVCPFSLNQGYCCDAEGCLYSFDKQTGFRKIFQTEYSSVCYANKSLYAISDNIVLRLDMSGIITGVYQPPYRKISAIAASGNEVGILCEDKCIVCKMSDFNPVSYDEVSQDSYSVTSEWETQIYSTMQPIKPDESDALSQTKNIQPSVMESHAVFTLNSSNYKIDENVIYDIPIGTTAAVLRSNMTYPNCTLTFTDYKGRNFSSGKIGTGTCLNFLTDNGTNNYYTVVYGDITGEGSVNTLDISAAAKYLVGTQKLSVYEQSAADVDRDGEVTLKDLFHLQNVYYEYDKELPEDIFCQR